MNEKTRKPAVEAPPPWAAGTENRQQELYPELTEDQIDIVRRYGEEREFSDATILWNIGDRDCGFFLVLSGAIEVFRRDCYGEHVIATHGRGHYGGETATMSGRGAYLSGRTRGRTRVIEVTRERLRELISSEADLGETILLSFILRRMRMIAEHHSNIILIGSSAQRDTVRIRTFLTRNGVPHEVEDVDATDDMQACLRAKGVTADALPVLICDGNVRTQPSNREIAECLGFDAELVTGAQFDVAVVGAGPAGLAAAVYAASEGLRVVVIESCAPGGQAGTSSRIENYLGFPTGISGQALAGRAYIQAQKFGAEIAVARRLVRLHCGDPRAGARWRRPNRGARGGDRHGRGLSQATHRGTGGLPWRRRTLRRELHRGTVLPGQGRCRGRRRQLCRAGGHVSLLACPYR